MKLRSSLILLVVAVLLPAVVFVGAMLVAFNSQQLRAGEHNMIETTRALSLAVDRELEGSIRILQVLGASDDLSSEDLKEFYGQARQALKTQERWSTIILFDARGRQLLNLLRPFGSVLPESPPIDRGIHDTVVLKRPLVSNLFFGRIPGEPRIAVNVPVMINGEVKYILGANFSPRALFNLLKEQNIPLDALATIMDRNQAIIARTRDFERFVGEPGTALVAANSSASQEGSFQALTDGGIPVYQAFHRSHLSGWTVSVAIPVSTVQAPLRRSLVFTAAGGLTLLLLGTGLATLFGRRIAISVAALSDAAAALGRGELPEHQRSFITELDRMGQEIQMAAAQRRRGDEALRAGEERYRLVAKATNDAIWDWDVLTGELQWNDNVQTLFGYSPEEVRCEVPWWSENIHPEDRGKIIASLEAFLSGNGQFWAGEYRYGCRNGSYAYVLDRGYVVRDRAGKPLRMIGCMTDITEHKRAEEKLQQYAERLQTLSRRLVEVQETERRSIARELHDEVGQALTGLKLSLQISARLPPETATARLTYLQALVNELIARVRDLSLNLRPTMLDDLGLLPTLLWHFEKYKAQTLVHVAFKHNGIAARRFDPNVETAVYRIAQEGLTNVARYAGVSEVTVEIWADQKTLALQIRDRGVGFDTSTVPPAGMSGGLSGMRERALTLGGQLSLDSIPGGGTLLRVELPVVQGRDVVAPEDRTLLANVS